MSILLLLPTVVTAERTASVSSWFKALKPAGIATRGSWAILQRDGANREVPPYLSSLGQGETGIGIIASPAFSIASETISFTIRGHDGQGGGRQKTFIALVDVRKGKTLLRTFAPGTDVLQERTWDVAKHQGREVRIEVHDELAEAAYAWLGIGRIDAGRALQADFSKGLPDSWRVAVRQADLRTTLVTGDGATSGLSFRRLQSAYSMISTEGATEIPCGFIAKRLFLLGCTISEGRPLEIGGWVEIVYDEGPSDRIPLMIGYTLDRQCKLLSRSPAMHLHRSSDPFQHYLVIRPRQTRITAVRLDRNTGAVPRITAITCETDATCDALLPLPDRKLEGAEKSWIGTHIISAANAKLIDIETEIRKAHKIQAVTFQRSKISDRAFEAASACDLNNDGVTDIVSGGFWYEGPEFTSSHRIREVKLVGEYLDDFSDYPMDVNGDGYTDIVTGAYFGNPLQWIENPRGKAGPWPVHDICQVGPIETVRCWDVDGDGRVEVVPNAGGNVITMT